MQVYNVCSTILFYLGQWFNFLVSHWIKKILDVMEYAFEKIQNKYLLIVTIPSFLSLQTLMCKRYLCCILKIETIWISLPSICTEIIRFGFEMNFSQCFLISLAFPWLLTVYLVHPKCCPVLSASQALKCVNSLVESLILKPKLLIIAMCIFVKVCCILFLLHVRL